MAGAYDGALTMGEKVDRIIMFVFSGEGNEEYEHIFRVIQVYTSEPGVQYLELDEEWARPYFEEIYAFVYKLIDYFLFYRYNQYDGPFTRSARRRAAESLFDAYVQTQSDLEHTLLHQFDEFLTEVILNPVLVAEINQIKVGADSEVDNTVALLNTETNHGANDTSPAQGHNPIDTTPMIPQNGFNLDYNTYGSGFVNWFFYTNREIIINNLMNYTQQYTGYRPDPGVCQILLIGGVYIARPVVRGMGTAVHNRFLARESTGSIISRLMSARVSALDITDLTRQFFTGNKLPDLKRKILQKQKDEQKLNGLWLAEWRLHPDDLRKITDYNDGHKPAVKDFRTVANKLIEIMFVDPTTTETEDEKETRLAEEKRLAINLQEGSVSTPFTPQERKQLFSELLKYYAEINEKEITRAIETKFIDLFPNPIPLQPSS